MCRRLKGINERGNQARGWGGGGGCWGGSPCDDLYGKAPPKRGTFSSLQVCEKVGISLVKEYKRVGKSFICSVKGSKRANRYILWFSRVYFCD